MNLRSRTIAPLLLTVISLPAQAELTATLTLTSDYLFDGITQTQGDPALQGSIDYGHESGFYAGVWSSNINYANTPDVRAEVDYYFGYASDLCEHLDYDIGWARYTYPGVTRANSFDYNEVYASLSHKAGTGIKVWRSGDYVGSGSSSVIWKLTQDLDVGKGYNLHLEYDETQVERKSVAALSNGEDQVSHYAIGLSKGVNGMDWDLSYHNTSEDDAAFNIAQPTWVLTVSKTFNLEK